jgi:hypothetical protein
MKLNARSGAGSVVLYLDQQQRFILNAGDRVDEDYLVRGAFRGSLLILGRSA